MNKKKIPGVALVVILTICFIADVSTYIQLSTNVAYLIMAFLIGMAMIHYMLHSFLIQNKNKEKVIRFQIKYNFMPKVVIYAYTLFLIWRGFSEGRYISSNLQTFINGLSAVAVFYLFGSSAFYYSCIAVILTYISVLFAGIVQNGLNVTFEFHDLAFSVGYIVLYFYYTKTWKRKKEFILFILFLFMIIAARKRIELLALLLVGVWYKLASVLNEKQKRYFILISGIMLIIFSFLFVQFVMNPNLLEVMSRLSIDMSGRDYYYIALQPYIKYDITFLGLGRNSVQVIMTEDFPWFHIGNIHSDIFRMYAECGFILFLLWLICYLVWMEVSAVKKFGIKAGEFVFMLTMYTFAIYFTDNTELYLMNQYFYILTMLVYTYKEYGRLRK